MVALIRDDPLTKMLQEEKKLRENIITNPLKMEKLRKLAARITGTKDGVKVESEDGVARQQHRGQHTSSGGTSTAHTNHYKTELGCSGVGVSADSGQKFDTRAAGAQSADATTPSDGGGECSSWSSNHTRHRGRDATSPSADRYGGVNDRDGGRYGSTNRRSEGGGGYSGGDTGSSNGRRYYSDGGRDFDQRHQRDVSRDYNTRYRRDVSGDYNDRYRRDTSRDYSDGRNRLHSGAVRENYGKQCTVVSPKCEYGGDTLETVASADTKVDASAPQGTDGGKVEEKVPHERRPVLQGYMRSNSGTRRHQRTHSTPSTTDAAETQRKLQQMMEDGEQRTQDARRLLTEHEQAVKQEEKNHHRSMGHT
uniref:Uncharacterized protein n=1 Tax=Lygus hesperus TaxID=30085 RepID=A0A0A9WVK2_LYGHE